MTLIHEKTTEVEIDLNEKTVICSSADYGAFAFLKILIPQLSDLTVLNHRNIGAAAPCVAAGDCRVVGGPDTILDIYKPTEKVNVAVKLYRKTFMNESTGWCEVSLVEVVETKVREKDFFHRRESAVDAREPADCI